jgi:hypothetical protein
VAQSLDPEFKPQYCKKKKKKEERKTARLQLRIWERARSPALCCSGNMFDSTSPVF